MNLYGNKMPKLGIKIMKNNLIKQNRIITFFIAIISLFILSNFTYAQTTFVEVRDQTKENTQQIKNIGENIGDLKENYRLLYDGAKNQNDQLGNQISFLSYILAIFGFLFAWYINIQYEKIREMKDIVKSTKEYIDGHNNELYEKITRDETVKLLTRLKEVPEDIENICQLLLSRDLLEEDYSYLKEPYLKIKNDELQGTAKDEYIILFLQHFPYQSLKDPDLKIEIVSNVNLNKFNGMFIRDVKNLFDGVFKYLKEFGVIDEENKLIIKNLFYNYSKSKFQANIELKNFIKDIILKFQLNTADVLAIAKEQAPNDSLYMNWLNSCLR